MQGVLTISHRGITHSIPVDTDISTVESIKESLEEATGIPSSNQKLLHKLFNNAPNEASLSTLLNSAGIQTADQLSSLKIMMIGTSAKDIDEVKRKDTFSIRKKRTIIPQTKAFKPFRHPTPPIHIRNSPTPPRIPRLILRKNLLLRLREDVGIIEVMRKHQWFVNTLTELHPAEKSILGFNKNMGQEISIRLRTDRLDGFRHYRTIVKVLLHELVHMEISEHNNEFHELNSVLNREYDLFSLANSVGGGREDGSRVFSTGEEGGDTAELSRWDVCAWWNSGNSSVNSEGVVAGTAVQRERCWLQRKEGGWNSGNKSSWTLVTNKRRGIRRKHDLL
ncbi:WLM-domain-containing protein [Rhizoclosmatium globosum]|uniref:WLM-domain-containing protein n=1 Tax=Rhizoclosmatium globosum TaxID=329046 RepID=A0A1Y2CI18_9FUNG|nr:WLM-domain-containing protein [Rhizoclosmatium globosum]|eukprot:ORY46557.1 WLM-domain-containing protein [Rhizoclosmatium globosum]